MKGRITQPDRIKIEAVSEHHARVKAAVHPSQTIAQTIAMMLSVFAIVCMLTLVAVNNAAAEPVLESPFLPDDNEFFTGKKGVKGNWLTDTARSLDNNELLLIANNLRINDMSAGQRVHNYYWIQGGNDKLTSGKSISKFFLQSFAKAYWNQLRASEFKGLSVIPDADGAGSFVINRTDIDYKLRLSGDRIKLMVKLDF